MCRLGRAGINGGAVSVSLSSFGALIDSVVAVDNITLTNNTALREGTWMQLPVGGRPATTQANACKQWYTFPPSLPPSLPPSFTPYPSLFLSRSLPLAIDPRRVQ